MALPSAAVSGEEEVLPLADEGEGCEFEDEVSVELGLEVEVKCLERLPLREPRLADPSFDAVLVPLPGLGLEDRPQPLETRDLRRVGEVAALFANAGFIVITAFISPYQVDRDRARAAAGDQFHEIYIKADLDTCEQRDPKGLYRRARAGQIPEFTGISAPYEAPARAELVVDTTVHGVDDCVEQIVAYIENTIALSAATQDAAASG